MREQTSAKAQEKRVAEDLWLSYFNRYLYEHGVISEQDYGKMAAKIAERKHHTPTRETEQTGHKQ